MKLNFTGAVSLAVPQALLASAAANASIAAKRSNPAVPNIFSPSSTPADSVYHLSLFVLEVTGVIFVVVFSLLAYAVIKFRRRPGDDGREPPQVYGSNQMELAWTVIPVLIVVVLFLAAARVIHAVEDAKFPPGTTEITAVGHQFWWEFRFCSVWLQRDEGVFDHTLERHRARLLCFVKIRNASFSECCSCRRALLAQSCR